MIPRSTQLRPETDLVIMGRPRSQHFWKFFNKKTAQRAIEEAECGVLVVHA